MNLWKFLPLTVTQSLPNILNFIAESNANSHLKIDHSTKIMMGYFVAFSLLPNNESCYYQTLKILKTNNKIFIIKFIAVKL